MGKGIFLHTEVQLWGSVTYLIRQICKILTIAVSFSVCVSVYLPVTIACTGHTLAKIKNVKNYICIFWNLPSNGIIAKIVLRGLDLLCEDQRFELRPFHSGKRPYKCNDCKYCCTPSSSLASHKLNHSSKCPFKCASSSVMTAKLSTNWSQASAPSKVCFTWQCPTRLIPSLHFITFEGDAKVLTI